jgi:predicted PurR-regulated permease PerM
MENIILLIATLVCAVAYCFKSVRAWLGKSENHNSAIVLIAFLGVVIALPVFTKQINNIEVKVDSLAQSIQGIYNSYTLESFCYDDLKNSFTKDSSGNVVQIKLKNKPVPHSVNVWEGPVSVNPLYFKIDGNILNISTNFDADSFKQACDTSPDYRYTITYIPEQ